MPEPTVYGWRASITHDWAMQGNRLHIFQRSGQELLLITGFDERGIPITEKHHPGTMPAYSGIFLPDDSLDALAAVIDPTPSKDLVEEVRSSLIYERGRVDSVLKHLLSQRPSNG